MSGLIERLLCLIGWHPKIMVRSNWPHSFTYRCLRCKREWITWDD